MTESKKRETQPGMNPADYWSFAEMASRRIAEEMDDIDSVATKLIITLNRAANLVVYDLESTVHRPRGMSWAAFRVLFVVWLAGPLESGRAAKFAGMSRAAVSNLTNTLVSKDYLVKEPSEADGRTTLLRLTDAGTEYARAAFAEQNAQEARWASTLTDVEQQLLVMLLEKLISQRGKAGARLRD
ncbi:MarR family winged helix-turn-helix transcriptional regulator [Glutamicibacter sp.]|jgi:Transcriptional regulators|uniref:MarR family winged helix-turn-helix transcriptional regulator n=1 Tax=Glutamicibacter sp. TaxID=1931995 RepID=UPI002B458D73|nr:MarR family transcriptional regulator [Glutamicibacter sp.]HJX78095.1 MarR family transcriptional regulator [Glutamicibacter sp.]